MSNHNTAKRVALYGVYFAVIFVAFNIDSLLSLILPIKFAIVTISVVATLVLLSSNLFEAGLVGCFFGLSSLLSQLYLPKVPEFLNPLASVLPRICVGLGVFGMFLLMRKLTQRNRYSELISATVAGGSGAIINTVLVMAALSIFRSSPYLDMIKSVLVANFIPEFVGACILVPIISIAVSKAIKQPLGGIKNK